VRRAASLALAALAAGLAAPGAEAAFGPFGRDAQLSHMGSGDGHLYSAYEPSVAYNSTASEYLVVWVADDDTPPLVDNEFEIYAQRLSGAGAPLGGRIRVSAQGPDGSPSWSASDPTVAYNPLADEYLVAWQGRIATTDPFDQKIEIWGRRISAAGEKLGGSDDVQISNTGLEDSNSYDALNPSVAANAETGEYLVVWQADDLGVDDEFEIMGQRLNAAGEETGGNDFRISEQGADGNPESDAFEPSVAWNPVTNEYLVAWEGELGTTDVFEIWGQRLSAEGAEVGGNDFRISELYYTPLVSSSTPSVAANPKTGDYLVVWTWDHDQTIDEQLEIHGQRLTAAGAQVGADDFQISDMDTIFDSMRRQGFTPSVAAGPATGEYTVVWNGSDDTTLPSTAEFEIFGQRLSAEGVAIGEDDFRISHIGPDGSALAQTATPSLAAGLKGDQLFVAFAATEVTASMPLGAGVEIFGHRLGSHFGPKTQVRLALAATRIPARGPLRVRVRNLNEFAVTGTLRGSRPLKARTFRVKARGRLTVKLKLPQAVRLRLRRDGVLALRLAAKVKDPAGLSRTVQRYVRVRLRR
jgi:hypothetical protein